MIATRWRPFSRVAKPASLGTTVAFEQITPSSLSTPIITTISGAGLAAVSSILPTYMRPFSIVGGVGLMGAGIYGVLNEVFGGPKTQVVPVPHANPEDLAKITGEIIQPVDGGAAELSTMWSAFWKTDRTYAIGFRISNQSDKDLKVSVAFKVEEKANVFPNKVSISNYVVEVPKKQDKFVSGYQPVMAILTFGIDCIAELILRGSGGAPDRVLSRISFDIF